jgi:hypothetical protein
MAFSDRPGINSAILVHLLLLHIVHNTLLFFGPELTTYTTLTTRGGMTADPFYFRYGVMIGLKKRWQQSSSLDLQPDAPKLSTQS